MRRRDFLAAPSALLAQAPQRQPNIVLILADDLGWKDAGFHGGATPTPHIDRIAAEGVRFTQFYATPLCTPTRASLMSGRCPVRYGLIYSVIRPWSPYGLPADEHILPQTLRDLGYQTAMVGKWHLGHAHRRMFPQARGFDHFYGCVNAEIDYFEHTKQGGLDWQRNGVGVREAGYSTDLLAAEATKLIRERRRDKPLFLYAAFNAVHAPLQASAELLAKYAHVQPKSRQALAAMTDSLDQAVGRILAELEGEGMTRDTLVIFLSDNGGAGPSVNLPYRAGKLTVFEGGIRVPGVMRWPGELRPGSEVSQVASVLDLLPMLARVAGGKPGSAKLLDGIDLWPQVTGAAPVPRGSLFWACKRNETADYQFAVRAGDWKLIRQVTAGKPSPPDLLFNLQDDPFEKDDLAARHPAQVKALAAELDRWKALHPAGEVQSSMTPHPGWIPPKDYSQAPDYDS